MFIMKIKIITISILFAMFCTPIIYSQEHDHHTHAHLLNEIGLSSGAFYAFGHQEWGSGIHIHYFRTLSPHSKWALGGSIEQAWIDGSHFNLSVGAKYQLFDKMSIAAFPGITFFSHNEADIHNVPKHTKDAFSLHFEMMYDLLHWEKFHFGAVIDYSLTKKDSHAMIGIHAAFCF